MLRKLLVAGMAGICLTLLTSWAFALVPARWDRPGVKYYEWPSKPGWFLTYFRGLGYIAVSQDTEDRRGILSWPSRPPRRAELVPAELPTWAFAWEQDAPSEADWKNQREVMDFAFGWPVPAMHVRLDGNRAANTGSTSGIDLHGICGMKVGRIEYYPTCRALPLRPLRSGFILDSACFAAMLLGLITATGALGRFRRARRRARLNHCPSCNYDRTGLPAASPCPECGLTAPRHP
jgi:hypothetical protein